MKVQRFVYHGVLPTLNKILNAKRRRFKNDAPGDCYSDLKTKHSAFIAAELRVQKIRPVQSYPIRLSLVIYALNRKTDTDNIEAGAKKFLLDALKTSGIIRNDGWSELISEDGTVGEATRFLVDAKEPRVELLIVEPHTKGPDDAC